VNVEFWHIALSGPAFTTTCLEIFSITWLLIAEHEVYPVAVSVSVTLPPAISAAVGVYIGCSIEVLSNVPEPDVDHSSETILSALDPERVNVLPSQMVAAGPASAVAGRLTVSARASVTLPQGAFANPVNVRVTIPLSPAPGV
jgi:hypothetical protein